MTPLDILTSPFIQLFILGLVAGLFKSDLELPEAFTKAISLYLMLSIGLKAGVVLSGSETSGLLFAKIALIGSITGFLIPFLGYFILHRINKIDILNSSNIAAHYGSISAVTFSYALSFLDTNFIAYSAFMVALMAIMESPGIIAGLILANKSKRLTDQNKTRLFSLSFIREVLFNSSVVLLLGGILIGYTSPASQIKIIKPYLIDPFYGILCLFLLDMGLLVAKYSHSFAQVKRRVFLFGIYMPLLCFAISLVIGKLVNFSKGDALLFSILCASSSYIAVPAAMKVALPNANHSLSITLSLAVTFTFNILIGVPLYYWIISLIF
ncbi:MAG: sodium-dependent bicarbonate transport family permease [Rickettsiales bacterium]